MVVVVRLVGWSGGTAGGAVGPWGRVGGSGWVSGRVPVAGRLRGVGRLVSGTLVSGVVGRYRAGTGSDGFGRPGALRPGGPAVRRRAGDLLAGWGRIPRRRLRTIESGIWNGQGARSKPISVPFTIWGMAHDSTPTTVTG